VTHRLPWTRPGSLAPLALALLGAAAPGATVEPETILAGATYRGTTLRVRGVADPGVGVHVTVCGAPVEERFNWKGRVGPVWANLGHATFSGVPSLCLIATDRSAPRPPADAAREHRLDLDAVVRSAAIESDSKDLDGIRLEYLRLKQSQGLYAAHDGAVRVEPQGTSATYEAEIPWPEAAAPGEYAVHVVHVRDGVVVRDETARVRLELVGLPRFISDMAFRSAELYGALAVAVALVVGFAMGRVFKRGGGH
jgi:hypothetical protein